MPLWLVFYLFAHAKIFNHYEIADISLVRIILYGFTTNEYLITFEKFTANDCEPFVDIIFY